MGHLQSSDALGKMKSKPRPSNLLLQIFPQGMPKPLDNCRQLSCTVSLCAGWLSPRFWITFAQKLHLSLSQDQPLVPLCCLLLYFYFYFFPSL